MQTVRTARREAMSFFEKSQTRKRTMRKMKATAKNDDEDEDTADGYSE